jgi:S1-C subfamily serine protease
MNLTSHPIAKIGLLVLVQVTSVWGFLPDEQNNIDIYQKWNPSVVNITATTLRQNFFYELYPQKGLGSGAIIGPEGYILTNEHVIGRAVEVEVTLHDKSTFPAKVVGHDPDSDIAILKINPKGKRLVALEYGNWDKLAVGQKVLAIGNPFGFGGSLSVGVISSLGRDIRASNESPIIKDVIQTDAAINPGNSGGPLLDSSGKLIGVNAQIYSQSGGSEGIGFAISVKTLKKIVPQLIQFGEVLRPWLGIDGVGLSSSLLANLNIPVSSGVMLIDTYEGSPAEKAGLVAATKQIMVGYRPVPYGGDVLYQIDKTPVSTLRDIIDYIADKKTGESVTIYYVRGKAKKTVTVKLALPPSSRGKSL